MHTSPVSDCASASPAAQVRAYHKRGYSGVIITDHFINGNSGCPSALPWERKMAFFIGGYTAAKKEGDRIGLDVFFGLEFNIRGAEFLTYGLTPDFLFEHPGLDGLSVEQYSALVRDSGGYLAQAHPYRTAWWIAKPGPVDPALIDGIEVYNASMIDRGNNAKALAFAKKHGLPMQAGSDSHHVGFLESSGIALPYKAKDIFEIIGGIKAEKAELIV
jgi:hypothetical protein